MNREKAMSHRIYHKEKKGKRRILQGISVAIILAICFDYGKHWVFKKSLEKGIAQSKGLVSLESVTLSFWPLGEGHLVLKNFHLTLSDSFLTVEKIHIRQGWLEWGSAHIEATNLKVADVTFIQEARGVLDTTDLQTRVAVSPLILTGIHTKLPLLSFSGPQATLDCLYDIVPRRLSMKVDAPNLSFSNGATFGFNGEGALHIQDPLQGKINVKFKNIDKMMQELVAANIVEASQAKLVSQGSHFLGSLGVHDITLPLTIQDGAVSLGPVPLFKLPRTIRPQEK